MEIAASEPFFRHIFEKQIPISPELQVVHHFKARCHAAVGSLPVYCRLYFCPGNFRHGSTNPILKETYGADVYQNSLVYETQSSMDFIENVDSFCSDIDSTHLNCRNLGLPSKLFLCRPIFMISAHFWKIPEFRGTNFDDVRQ